MGLIRVENPAEYFDRLGDMHDAVVKSVHCDFESRTLEIAVDDIYSNFVGLPEYPGLVAATLVFKEASSVECDIEPTDTGPKVYGVEIAGECSLTKVLLTLAPAGRISCHCESIEIEKAENKLGATRTPKD